MTEDELLKDLLRPNPGKISAVLKWAEVIGIDKEQKLMDARTVSDDLEIYDVQLGTGSVILYPKIGSICVIGLLEGMNTDAILISCSEVERIEINANTEIALNGGSNGGLINIETLTEKINGLVEKFNTHTHQVSTTGSASSQQGTASPVTSKAEKLDKNDYEDTLVTH